MIGLDTNVLVRLLTGDDVNQQAAAKAFIESECSTESPAFINRVALVETVWVLESAYKYRRESVAAAVDALLRMVSVLTEDEAIVRSALGDYRRGADFADALIAVSNAVLGCTKTVTFDRKATKKTPHLVNL